MLDDINKLLLTEQKKLNILAFSIQSKNKHHLNLTNFHQQQKIEGQNTGKSSTYCDVMGSHQLILLQSQAHGSANHTQLYKLVKFPGNSEGKGLQKCWVKYQLTIYAVSRQTFSQIFHSNIQYYSLKNNWSQNHLKFWSFGVTQ